MLPLNFFARGWLRAVPILALGFAAGAFLTRNRSVATPTDESRDDPPHPRQWRPSLN